MEELSRFQDFLYRNFYNHERYKDTKPDSNQPVCLYGKAKTQKSKNLKEITVVNLRFRHIIDQTGTFMYNVVNLVSDYLRPLCKNQYSIDDMQNSQICHLKLHLCKIKKVQYDVELLFTNIPREETINYITEQIYVHKKLTPICLKLIFRRLLVKHATECTFKFNNRFLKQVDGCALGGPLSVTFNDIYMVKIENDIVIPSKAIFY